MSTVALLLLVARAGPLADGLLGLLSTIPDLEVVGPVEDLSSALVAASELGPAAVLLDSGLSARHTTAMVGRLRAASPESRCIVLADDVQQQRAAERAGADAVLLKGCRPTQLVATARGLLQARLSRLPRPRPPTPESLFSLFS